MSSSAKPAVGRRAFLGSGLAMIAAAAAAQSEPTPYSESDPRVVAWPPRERFPLWPGKPPGAPAKAIVPNWTMNNPPPNRELWIRGVPMPEVHVFRAAHPDGSALLAVPGGGYEFLSVQNEGIDAAERFNAERTTVFVLTYRLPGEGWSGRSLVPLQDAQRAMRLIRSRAGEFRVDAARLGVIGFSAGGHLAADRPAQACRFAEGAAAGRPGRARYAGFEGRCTGARRRAAQGEAGADSAHEPCAEGRRQR